LWSQILLILISLFSCVVVYRRLSKLPHPEYLSYSILLLNAVAFGMIIVGQEQLARIIELSFLSVSLLVLVLLMISIRLLQPQHTRYPVVYSYFPLLLLPFYAYFIDSEILQFITNMTVQATALLVYVGLVITYWNSIDKGYLLFLSLLAFASAFLLKWFPWFDSALILPATHLLAGIGMIISSFKFPSILTKHKR